MRVVAPATVNYESLFMVNTSFTMNTKVVLAELPAVARRRPYGHWSVWSLTEPAPLQQPQGCRHPTISIQTPQPHNAWMHTAVAGIDALFPGRASLHSGCHRMPSMNEASF